jgi:hypothetical protein
MPLLSLTQPPTMTSVKTSVSVDAGHPEADLAVVDQERVAGRRAAPCTSPGSAVPSTSYVVALLQPHRATGEALEPDLGALRSGPRPAGIGDA